MIIRHLKRPTAAFGAAALAALLAFAPAAADDRDLFRQSADSPYLFILFDATGSMEWELGRSVAEALRDDDPDSRMYRAKRALDTVIQELEVRGGGVNLGFATFPDQDGHRAYTKITRTAGTYIDDRESYSNWCDGWDPNDDHSQDLYRSYSYKWDTTSNARGLDVGDIVPLDWGDDNLQRIRERLAPNLALGETVPDYGIQRYFEDPVCGGGGDSDDSDASSCGPANGYYLPLRDERARPFLARGATPLEGVLDSFDLWYDGWKDLANANDPSFALGCRKVFVVLLTDGFETCGGRPTTAAASLLSKGIKTYVVGFAVNNPALDAIAVAGGTDASPGPDGEVNAGDPEHEAFFAGDEQALVDAFLTIIGDIQQQSRTFATAAVPSVVGSSADEIFLTSFSPVADGTSLWPGRVDAYLKPVPLTTNAFGQAVPDRNDACAAGETESCLAWKADVLLTDQAPSASDVAADTYRVSNGTADRRVYYAQASNGSTPMTRKFFVPPTDAGDRTDLYGPTGMGLDPASPSFANDGRDVVRFTLQKKSATIVDPVTGVETTTDFVLGDIFHSDPQVIGEPSRFDYFSTDLEGQAEACGTTNDERDRYPCFVRDHLYRRKVLILGSNEGQVHAFDAGNAEKDADGVIEFNRGTGKEMFSFIPRSVLSKVRSMAEGNGQQYTVDGTLTVDDVLIDPETSPSSPPDLDSREWRTVAIGGLREGGAAYYALDVTQPDQIASDTGLPIVTSQVPGCLDGGSGCGPTPYGSMLWEFTDTWDEDATNAGAPDLGDTWSRANVGRIRVRDGTDVVDKYVAIVGGGLDADYKRQPVDPDTGIEKKYSGNYLYMIDVETGEAIYKRRLDIVNGVRQGASVPSEPAAVDTDQDSYIDTIYIGTTAGYMFKVDVSEPVSLERDVSIADYSTNNPATGGPPLMRTADRITSGWDPFAIFDTGGRPIYFAPSVIYVSDLASYALAFGVGDREDLWSDDGVEGRFYVLLDNALGPDPSVLPFSESALEVIDADASKDASPQGNLLTNPDTSAGKRPGWTLVLDANERVVAKSFGLAGVVFFNSYIPDTTTPEPGVCATQGSSRLYSVFATNGLGIRTSGQRFKQVGDFTTKPFIEASGGIKKGASTPTAMPDECDSEELAAMAESIKGLMPSECKFANYRLNVMTLESSSGLQCLVPVPVCVIERNWKEF